MHFENIHDQTMTRGARERKTAACFWTEIGQEKLHEFNERVRENKQLIDFMYIT